MKIYRDGKAIELTGKEICDIYIEARRRYYGDEVLLKLSEDYNIDIDKEDIEWKQIALDVMDTIAEDDTHWDCEQDAYRRVIEKYLKERGLMQCN